MSNLKFLKNTWYKLGATFLSPFLLASIFLFPLAWVTAYANYQASFLFPGCQKPCWWTASLSFSIVLRDRVVDWQKKEKRPLLAVRSLCRNKHINIHLEAGFFHVLALPGKSLLQWRSGGSMNLRPRTAQQANDRADFSEDAPWSSTCKTWDSGQS